MFLQIQKYYNKKLSIPRNIVYHDVSFFDIQYEKKKKQKKYVKKEKTKRLYDKRYQYIQIQCYKLETK